MKYLITALVFILTLHYVYTADQICPTPLPKKYEHLQPGSVVAAYFGNWDIYGTHSYKVQEIESVAHNLTHLVYGFMKPDDIDGRCKPHDPWADLGIYDGVQTKVGGNFAKMKELKKKFPHLKILLSIGGGTYNKNFLNLIKDRKKLLQFAQSCVDMLDFYDHTYVSNGQENRTNHLEYQGLFDGLDIDWEWSPSQVTDENSRMYTQFIQEIARLLKEREQDSLLTVALQVTPKVYQNLELEEIASYINWFHVMAYDFYGPQSGLVGFNAPICSSNASYSVDGALQGLMMQGVSPDKLVLGLPLYGYVYEDSAGYKSTIKQSSKVKAMSYHLIKSKYLDSADCQQGWNSFEKAASCYNKKDRVFISYDGKDSLREKVKLAKYKKLQGVVLWRLSGDDQNHGLVKALHKAMQQN